MPTDEKYDMRLSKEEQAKWKEFGKKHGKTSVAKLIRASVEVVQRNPSLLQITETVESAKMLESIEESLSVFDDASESFEKIYQKIDQLQRFQEWIVKKLGASETEIKTILKKDISGEAVFEE